MDKQVRSMGRNEMEAMMEDMAAYEGEGDLVLEVQSREWLEMTKDETFSILTAFAVSKMDSADEGVLRSVVQPLLRASKALEAGKTVDKEEHNTEAKCRSAMIGLFVSKKFAMKEWIQFIENAESTDKQGVSANKKCELNEHVCLCVCQLRWCAYYYMKNIAHAKPS